MYSYPIVEFKGAKCHQIRQNVYHMMRGEVMYYKNHKIIAMGGAKSQDRGKGDKYWWKQEMPTQEEFEYMRKQIEKYQPDILISHDAPAHITRDYLIYNFKIENIDPMSSFLDEIDYTNNSVKNWYFGHIHMDKIINTKDRNYYAMYHRFEKID